MRSAPSGDYQVEKVYEHDNYYGNYCGSVWRDWKLMNWSARVEDSMDQLSMVVEEGSVGTLGRGERTVGLSEERGRNPW